MIRAWPVRDVAIALEHITGPWQQHIFSRRDAQHSRRGFVSVLSPQLDIYAERDLPDSMNKDVNDLAIKAIRDKHQAKLVLGNRCIYTVYSLLGFGTHRHTPLNNPLLIIPVQCLRVCVCVISFSNPKINNSTQWTTSFLKTYHLSMNYFTLQINKKKKNNVAHQSSVYRSGK